MTKPRHATGFNLIEILIVLTIISLLSLVGTPLYTQHVAHAYRLEALVELHRLAAALERYYTEHHTYVGATLNQLHLPTYIAHHRYTLQLNNLSLDYYSVSARAIHKQAKLDASCTEMTLDALGEKSVLGEGSVQACWH